MGDINTRIIISARDSATATLQRISGEANRLRRELSSADGLGGGIAPMLGLGTGHNSGTATSALRALTGEAGNLRTALLDLPSLSSQLGTGAAMVGIAAMARQMIAVTEERHKVEAAMTNIYGNNLVAESRLQGLSQMAKELGINFQSLASNAKLFYASAAKSEVAGSAEDILRAFMEMGSALKVGDEQMQRVLLALAQMLSKGKITAEELRQQLGESLPGAVDIFAEAIGKSGPELDKMLQNGEVSLQYLITVAQKVHAEFGDKAKNAVHEVGNESSRLSNAWRALLQEMDRTLHVSDAASAGLGQAAEGVDQLANTITGLRRAMTGSLPWRDFMGADPAELRSLLAGVDTDPEYIRRRLNIAKQNQRSQLYAKDRDAAQSNVDAVQKQLYAALGAEGIKSAQGMKKDGWLLLDRGKNGAWDRSMEYMAENEKEAEKEAEKAARKAETEAEKIRKATESITADLAKMTDVGTEGQGRVGALTKKFDELAKTLGTTNPQVRAYAKEIEYAKQHNGYTEAEVAKATRAIELESKALQDRAEAIRESTREDGTVDQQRLALLQAKADAQRQYTEDLKKGVEESVAAKKRDLAISNAEGAKVQGDLQARIAFYGELAQLYPADADLQKRILDRKIEEFRAAGVAEVDIARWKEREKLKVATDAQSGITRAYQSWSDDATNMAKGFGDMFTNGMNNSSEVVAQFCRTGKLNFRGMVNSWLDDMARLASRQMTSSIFGSILGAVGSAAGSYFGGGLGGGTGGAASGAWGDYADRVVGIAGTRASGGPVLGGNTYLVGENGPELFTPDLAGAIVPNAALAGGAASDNRVLDALASLKDAITNMGGSGSPRIVNVLDQSLVHEAMASSGGEKVILNFIRSNAGAVKAALGTA